MKVQLTATIKDRNKMPVYPGARITLAASMILIMTFALTHHLSGAALTDLLALKGNSSENIISAKIHSMDSVYTITHHATFLVNKYVHIQRKSKLNMSQNLQSAILNQLLPVMGVAT